MPVTARSGFGSTTYEKRFAGGSINLANANSVMDLSMKTTRYGVKDEVSKWADTPNGDDPEALFFGRFTAFRRQKSYKILEISTPELDSGDELGEGPGHCRIDRSFRRSDQRFWHIACPQCAHEFKQSMELLKIDRDHPHRTVLGCPQCGYPITEMERVPAVRAGRFIAEQEGPDRHPGFHVDAFMSLMMSYEAIAEDFLKAEKKGSEAEIKNFWNLDLALPYAMRGNAPDHQRLKERCEDYPKSKVPEPALIFTAGADVQHDGIFVEAVGFAEDRQTWTVIAEFLPGTTDDVNGGAWLALDEIYRQEFADAFGGARRLDALAVDAGDGQRVNQAYEWCRRRPDCYAIRGMHGRGVPAIGTPRKTSVTRRGKKKKFGSAQAWPVGTWSLKGEFYGNLHKTGLAGGEAIYPPGYCHFGKFLNEEYFRQITAEYFHQQIVKGRLQEEWRKSRRDNHFLDCRIYAMAMAELRGLSTMTGDQWAALRAKIGRPADLFTARPAVAPPTDAAPPPDPKPKSSAREAWARRRT